MDTLATGDVAAGNGESRVSTYFHELTAEERKSLEDSGATWDHVMKNYKQPAWCSYPKALEGMMGCWSLVGGMVSGVDYCRSCDCFREAGNS